MKPLMKHVFILFFLASFYTASAQWSTIPDVDDTLNATVYDPLTFCSDGHGGAFFTWSQTFTGVTHYVIVNRIDSLGYLRFGDSGLVIHTDNATQVASGAPNICEDGKGGCYIVYTNNNLGGHPLVCHHLDSMGNPLWADTGIVITDKFNSQYYQNAADLVNIDSSGVIIAFNTSNVGADTSGIFAQRLNFNGSRQWGNHGSLVEGAPDTRFPRIVSDGKKGIAVIWTNYSFDGKGHQFQLRMNRLNHNGQLTFAGGTKKMNILLPVGYGPMIRLVLTKNKNYIVSWTKDGIGTPAIYAQKVDSLGNFLWGASEIKVRDTTGEVRSFDMMSDNNDGAYYSWVDGRKVNIAFGVFTQHINADSTKQWAAQGVRVDSATTGNYTYLAPDVSNRVKVFWVPSLDNKMHLQQLDANGSALLPGIGTVLTSNGHVPLYYKSVLPVSNNHDILFLKNPGNGKCYAKYIPFFTVLPLTHLRFTAVNDDSNNFLTWQTATEINSAFFSVERSEDGRSFHEIATVKSKNSPSANNEYFYTDRTSPEAEIFYRLKEVDFDGNYIYSNIVAIHSSVNEAFRIIPNPVSTSFTVYLKKIRGTDAVLKITDMNGRQLKQTVLATQQPSAVIDVSGLPAGTYFCRVEAGGEMFTHKIVVVH